MVTAAEVESTLRAALSPTDLVVTDISGGCGTSFEVQIVSSAFEGKRLLQRHQLVNSAMSPLMGGIHALSIKKVQTPEQAQQV